MKLSEAIKKEAQSKGIKIQGSEEAELEKHLNKMLYLDKKPDEELRFLEQVITRGTGTQERFGLHASSLIVSESKFCLRQQVLSLIYKQRQSEDVSPGLKRIFEEGNAIHEKWQRLFIRANVTTPEKCDLSQFDRYSEISYTPDIICSIPNKEYDWDNMVCEIKSVNTFQFKKMNDHPSGKLQLQFYMYLTGAKRGFTLCEDKNTQDIKVKIYDYDSNIVAPFIKRIEEIRAAKRMLYRTKKMVARKQGCNTSNCKTAESCSMRDACYDVGIGRVKLPKSMVNK